MLANAAQSESICAFCLRRLRAVWILSELFVRYHYQGSPHNLMLIDSLSVCQVKSLSWCRVVEFYDALYNNV